MGEPPDEPPEFYDEEPDMSNQTAFEQWAIVELMGHVRLAGRVTEESLFGTALGRIDIPNGDGFTTQYFGGGSVYRITPTTEEVARSIAVRNQPEPVHRWELPTPGRTAPEHLEDTLEYDDEGSDPYENL